MLVQSFRREVPGHDARSVRALLRQPKFSVAVLWSQTLVHDYGLLLGPTSFVTRYRRTQMSILLAGRGYFETSRGVRSLPVGSVVLSDQRRQEAEGYAGSPCELIVIDWGDGAPFGPVIEGEARIGMLDAHSVARLRALTRRLRTMSSSEWLSALTSELRALGLCDAAIDAGGVEPSPTTLARSFDALGHALGRLDDYPSMSELAEGLGVSERHANRWLRELAGGYAHPFDGWRDFVNESRIEWATQLLSLPELPIGRIAKIAGYRSGIALAHAFKMRSAPTPTAMAREHARRWR